MEQRQRDAVPPRRSRRAPPGPGTGASWPRGSRSPWTSPSSRASPPARRPGPAGGRGRPGRRAGRRAARSRPRGRRRSRAAGTTSRTGRSGGRSASAGTGRPNGSGSAARRASSRTAATSSGLVVNEITYRRQASTPNRAWSRAIDRNVARTSATRHAGGDLVRRARRPSRRAASAAAMDRGVLADLERGEVEPERRQLPAQLGDLAPGDPAEPVRARARAGARPARRRARRRPGSRRRAAPASPVSDARVRRSALGDRAQALPVRLLGEAAPELADGLGQLLGVAREGAVEAAVDALGRDPRGDGLHEPRGDRLVAAQQVVGLEPRGVERDLGGHARVPVAIGADPRPEPQQRRRGDRRASRSARRRRRARAARPRPPPSPRPGDRVERPVERPDVARDDREQRLVEDRERRPDLVERRRQPPRAGRPCATGA